VAPQHRASFAGHGLLALLRDLQWLSDDDTVPALAAEIAWLTRRPVEEVTPALMEVMGLGIFEVSAQVMFDPHLRAYKEKLQQLSEARAAAGAQGGSAPKARKAKGNQTRKAIGQAIGQANASTTSQASSTSTSTSTQPSGGEGDLSKSTERTAGVVYRFVAQSKPEAA
jgi:hypothetical protein